MGSSTDITEGDPILEDPGPEMFSLLDVVENQLTIINTLHELPTDTYDKMPEDVVKCLSLAFRVIQKIQVKLLKTI